MTMTMTFQKFLTKPLLLFHKNSPPLDFIKRTLVANVGVPKISTIEEDLLPRTFVLMYQIQLQTWIEKKMVRSGLFYQQYFYKFSLAVGLTFDRIKGQQSIKTFMTFCLPIKSGFVSKDLQNQTLFCSNESTLIKLKCNHLLAFLCTYSQGHPAQIGRK